MDKKLTFAGGEPNINFDDILRTPNANRDALIDVFRAFGDNYIIYGVEGTTSITAGYIMLDGEIVEVDAHTKTDDYFVKVTTYESGGDKTFNDAVPRQTWQKNRATISASSGSLEYATAERLNERIVTLNKASSAEAAALTIDTKFITPKTLVDGLGRLTAEVEIGAWDMEDLSLVSVAHGIADFTKIREVDVVVRNDAGTIHYPLSLYNNGDMDGGVTEIGSTNFVLKCKPGGFFRTLDFSSGAFNRGWITIKYLP